jgi:Zn finger protein HypA/HybF involved in hydrogenase expression
MGDIKNIEKNMPHRMSELICVNCKYRYIAIRPTHTRLKELICPKCGLTEQIIETGEVIEVGI